MKKLKSWRLSQIKEQIVEVRGSESGTIIPVINFKFNGISGLFEF
jgi:hypothetical protein